MAFRKQHSDPPKSLKERYSEGNAPNCHGTLLPIDSYVLAVTGLKSFSKLSVLCRLHFGQASPLLARTSAYLREFGAVILFHRH